MGDRGGGGGRGEIGVNMNKNKVDGIGDETIEENLLCV